MFMENDQLQPIKTKMSDHIMKAYYVKLVYDIMSYPNNGYNPDKQKQLKAKHK